MKPRVHLGFLDERIKREHKELLSSLTNKVGGKLNCDNEKITHPLCELCRLVLPLIVQIYAPLEKSQYHRTLYLFGCINPTCWNKKESWVCLRSQTLDSTVPCTVTESKNCNDNVDWCDGSDVWEVEEEVATVSAEQALLNEDELSDRISFLNCNNILSTEAESDVLPNVTAEIEDGEKMVVVDTPTTAQTDMVALFNQVTPVPQVSPDMLEFKSFFISVVEEELSKPNGDFNFISPPLMSKQGLNSEADNNKEMTEHYEKTLPAHGDKMFHRFISTIQKNPGQILRYIRDGGDPLFFYPASGLPQKCQHCNGDLVFELQLLPTLVSSLQLVGNCSGQIEFGTVFILACKNSCWSPDSICRPEYVYVQKELM